MKRALSTPKIMYFDEEFNGDLNINHILSSNILKYIPKIYHLILVYSIMILEELDFTG